jgi:parvulin-like peptidyl-prolyl isomerase
VLEADSSLFYPVGVLMLQPTRQYRETTSREGMANKKKQSSFKKYLVSIIIGFVAVAFVGSFAYNYAAKRGGGPSIAVVNGQTVAMGSDSMFANFYRQYYDEEQKKSGDKAMSEEKNRQLLRKALDSVIQRTLILQYAKKKGIHVSRDMVLEQIIQKGYYATPNKKFDEKRFTNTPVSDRKRIYKSEEEQLIIGMFIDELIRNTLVTDVETRSFYELYAYGKKIEYVFLRYDDVPEDRLKTFYEENPKLFERAHVAHILIKGDEKKANEVYEEVMKDPSRFAEIAKEKSKDPTAEKGGDLGWFYRNDMVPEFADAAFKLKKGQISKPVKTVFGYHIIKALDNVQKLSYDKAINRVKQEYVKANRDAVERATAEKVKTILEKATKTPGSFEDIVRNSGLRVIKTDYISLEGRYILNEDRSLPLYDLMGMKSLPEVVFSTAIGTVGGPLQSSNGEVIFKVIGEKKFDQAEYEKSKDYVHKVYTNLKENYLFNDWYQSALRNSRIVDNFNKVFARKG